jgi:hypothetical protein
MNINNLTNKKERIYEDLNRIRDIIVEMNVNKDEQHSKIMKYMNKIATLFYSEENEDRFIIAILLYTLTYKLKGKKIQVKSGWLNKLENKY